MKHGIEILVEEREQELLSTGEARGEARGVARGEARGEARGVARVAKNMKNKGESIDYIIKMTGLTVDDIIQL